MEHINIQPIDVNSQEPTCLAAFLVMAREAALPVSPEQARQLLSMAGVAWDSPASDWEDGLVRTLTVLTHPQGDASHA